MKSNKNDTILSLFYDQVQRTPSATAVVFEGSSMTYQELDERSSQVAHLLLAQGVQPQTLVAVCLDKSLEMIVALLAVLKAGCAYVPIDPDYPTDRIAYMLDDINASIVVTGDGHIPTLSVAIGERAVVPIAISLTEPSMLAAYPSSRPDWPVTGDDLAYIIYTSGSTGRPKGVMITHWNVVRLFFNDAPLFDFSEADVWTMFHSFCFDFSVWEMYGALLFGGKLVVVSKAVAKDVSLFSKLMVDAGVTILNQTPSAFYMLQDHASLLQRVLPLRVRYVIFGGEALNPAKLTPWMTLYPACRMINMYGITETTVHVTYQEINGQHTDSNASIIGKPIPTLYTYVLDEHTNRVPPGTIGELYVGGSGLAKGYLNQPELTASRFIPDPFDSDGDARLYRTGDLAKQAEDGTLEYHGRIDNQIKIRGFRIELGEIEHALQTAPGVLHGVVATHQKGDGDCQLVGYYVAEGFADNKVVRAHLQQALPDYMVPQFLIPIDAIPLTSNGKVDKKALPIPDAAKLQAHAYAAARYQTERTIADVWKTTLQIDRVGRHDHFFESGGNSLLAQKAVFSLKKQGIEVPVIKLYQYPVVKDLAAYVDGRRPARGFNDAVKHPDTGHDRSDIAVIGMAGRFPGAATIEALWEVLVNGRETIRWFNEDELDTSIPPSQRQSPYYVKARGIVDGAIDFDAAFFGINPKHAALMDPQQRLFLEIAWEALERSGHVPQKFDGSIGVYAGSANNTYFVNNVLKHPELVESAGDLSVLTINDKDYLSSRVAYALDLKGPAVTVQSACSTSLLAVAQAVEAIRKGQCDVAIAGGAAITFPIHSGHLYEEGAMLSADGHCRPFDKDARGTLFSDGVAAVVLKDKAQAERDGDVIYAVIKGVGISNDGGGKGSFTAPSAEGQARCIRMALADAGVEASAISYVETHGTGTPIGDPIEIEGLKLAFGEQAGRQYCRIGSIKSNMGHLTHAAGVAGLIKTVLALHHKKIPASINYSAANKAIDFASSPFVVNHQVTDWAPLADKRRAGVSSFGVGGTNVHVVLEGYEHATAPEQADMPAAKPLSIINWSAKNEASLTMYADRLHRFIVENPDTSIQDLAYSLQRARQDFDHRAYIVAADLADLRQQLDERAWVKNTVQQDASGVTFLFPGQGAQYVDMGKQLYEREPVYRQAIDDCASILHHELGEDIRRIIFPLGGDTEEAAAERLKQTQFTQPALFITEYALAKLWMSWGIRPIAYIGHSIGEFVAAHLAGVFTLKDALRLVAYRGKLISELPAGSMLSVRASASDIQRLMPPGLSIAAINAPSLCVVSGAAESVYAFSKALGASGIANKPLHTSHAFHSCMMDPMLPAFENAFRSITLRTPRQPIASTVTGNWLTDDEATDPAYWVQHAKATVNFSGALTFLDKEINPIFLEIGPGNVTATLARQHGKEIAQRVVSGSSNRAADEHCAIYRALGRLWSYGFEPDWKTLQNRRARRIAIPTYAFDRKPFWVSPNGQVAHTPANNSLPIANHTQRTDEKQGMTRKEFLIEQVRAILENASGIAINVNEHHSNFIELGFDSLLLTQVALALKKTFSLPITFRGLNESYYSLDTLGTYLDEHLEPNVFQPARNGTPFEAAAMGPDSTSAAPDAIEVLSKQIASLAQQVALLQRNGVQHSPLSLNAVAPPQNTSLEITSEESVELKKPFGAAARIEQKRSNLDAKQAAYLDNLVGQYNRKTAKSKAYTQRHRDHMADPRVVSGFKPETKEITYSIVANRSKGCRIWDIDGNEYIDVLNGFGSNFLGYQPELIKEALIQQIDEGYEIGPQHEKSGEVCQLICDFTGFDRAALCNTGSEAVLGTMRIARTVTGRSTIVAFTNSYHGIMDEVIVRGTKKLKPFPAAPGIMEDAVKNMLILDYGTEESLQIIRDRAHELAAVLVEPIQSRRPEFVPIDFLRKLRTITAEAGTPLIFDEVISGFRFHPRGAQGLFGIEADIATYGKVAGAGLSIGIIAGKKRFMDALDGGSWSFGDDSVPEAGVTYFAGTFVRHPLALATTKASLEYLKAQGPQLQERVNRLTRTLVDKLNEICVRYETPIHIVHFGSLWKVKCNQDYAYSELIFVAMRMRGIHILDGFPCFMTAAHTEHDAEAVVQAFESSVRELVDAGFIPTSSPRATGFAAAPPVPNARLGKDRDGNPAWFVEDTQNPGKYLQVVLN
ncbi:amino acid adenylation domain-containing protein [Parapedobacter deserti]|uniref:Amino acid adenylation domain-containing protein n=1 Tax=Parapedobacter deserti TaxID=1912957 RepID=A0ABV7JDG4_9SPHI